MRICVIANENAGSADQAAQLQASARDRDDVTWRSTSEAGDGIELARQAADEGFDVVAAAGGDGTVNEIVNGLMSAEHRPVLGVLPLGTGNDFARMLAMSPDNPASALDLLASGRRRRMDVIALDSPEGTIYGINAAAGGFSGQVGEALTDEMKANWGPMAYLIGAATVLPNLQDYDTYLTLDGGVSKQVGALNIVIANGRTIAGGKRVAPHADPEDGLLDVIVITSGSIVELADVATRLVAGNLAASEIVATYRTRHLHVDSTPGMWFNLDGELITKQPIEIEALPGALEVVVGDDYEPVVGL